MKLTALLALLLALPLAAQTPTPTPPCCPCCSSTPTPTPGGTPTWTPTPQVTPSPVTTPTSTPVPIAGTCTLTGTPVAFEPLPPGATRPVTLSPGFNNSLSLFLSGSSRRLLMRESYGYSVLSLANPVNPVAVLYADNRFGVNHITTGGDGQSDVYSLGVSDDGQRYCASLGGPADNWYTIAGVGSGTGFLNLGSFAPRRMGTTLIQHVGTRYLAYLIGPASVAAADISTLPASTAWAQGNMTSQNTGWPGGGVGTLAGEYIVYLSGGTIIVKDASIPGPPSNITGAYPGTVITSSELAGRISSFAAGFDGAVLWVLVELLPATGQTSPSYQLVSISSSLAHTVHPAWRIPALAGETWVAGVGASSFFVQANGSTYVLFWARRAAPTQTNRLFSTTVQNWPSVPGAFDVNAQNFAVAAQPDGFASGQNVYEYMPTGTSAFALSLKCQ